MLKQSKFSNICLNTGKDTIKREKKAGYLPQEREIYCGGKKKIRKDLGLI